MGSLCVDHVTVEFPLGGNMPSVLALSDVNFEIGPSEFVVALGASGCGKSTLLNLLAGFLSPSKGNVLLNGEAVAAPVRTTLLCSKNMRCCPGSMSLIMLLSD